MRHIVILAAVTLTACSAIPSQEEQMRFHEEARQAAIVSARSDCAAYGYSPGSGEFVGCVERRASEAYRIQASAYIARLRAVEADESARWAMAGAVMAGGLASSAATYATTPTYAPAPVYAQIRCRTVGNITTCN